MISREIFKKPQIKNMEKYSYDGISSESFAFIYLQRITKFHNIFFLPTGKNRRFFFHCDWLRYLAPPPPPTLTFYWWILAYFSLWRDKQILQLFLETDWKKLWFIFWLYMSNIYLFIIVSLYFWTLFLLYFLWKFNCTFRRI